MNNLFKKSVAVIASMGVLATTVNVNAFAASLVNAEFTAAYEWMKESNATTMPTEEAFLPYNNVTREQAPKMMINGLMAGGVELNKVRDYNLDFSDLTSADPSLQADIIKGYEYGLVNGWNGEYHPRDVVNRAQVMTILGRALYGQLPESAEYWKNYYKLLNTEGIFTIENAQAPIKRYELALVLYRVANLDRTANNETVDQLLCEVLGKEDCKKDDTTTDTNTDPVAKGDLDVSVTRSNDVVSIPGTATVVLGQVSFKGSEDITLKEINISRVGLGDNAKIKGIWFEKDGKRVSNRTNILSDSKANVRFHNGYVVKAKETLDLVVALSGSVNSEYAFKIDAVDSSAKNVTVSPDTTSTFRTTSYQVADINVTASNLTRTYRMNSDASFMFGEIKMANNFANGFEQNVKVQSFTVRNTGNADLANLKDIKLLRDGKNIDAKVTTDGRYITFVVNDIINSGRTARYSIMATPILVESEGGDEYKFEIRNTSDVVAVELAQNASYRTSVTSTELKLGEFKVMGGNLILSRDSKFPLSVNAGKGYSDVKIAKGTFTVDNGVHLHTFTLKREGSAQVNNFIKRAYLLIGNQKYTSTAITSTGIVFDTDFYISKGKNDFEITVDLLDTDTVAGSIEFKQVAFADGNSTFSANDAYYMNGNETNISLTDDGVGTIKVSKLNIKDAQFGLRKLSSYDNINILEGSTDEKTIFEGEVKNTTNYPIAITTLTLKNRGGNTNAAGKIGNVTVYVNGVPVGGNVVLNNQQTDNAKMAEVNGISTTLAMNETAKVEIRMIPDAGLEADKTYDMNVELTALSNGNEVTTPKVAVSRLAVQEWSDIKIFSNTQLRDSIVKLGEMSEVAAFNANILNAQATIDEIILNGESFDSLPSLQGVKAQYKNGTWAWINIELGQITTGSNQIKISLANDLDLEPGVYQFLLSSVYSKYTEDDQPGVEFKITSVALSNDGDTVSGDTVKYTHLLATAYPTLEATDKVNDNNTHSFKLKVTNPTNSQSQIYVTGITVADGTVTDEQTGLAIPSDGTPISFGSSATFKVTWTSSSVKVDSINFKVVDSQGNTSVYTNVKGYTNMATWGNLSL